MHNHEPPGYVCPFCCLVAGEETERNRRADVVYAARGTRAFVSPKWWASNEGHVIVIPDRHYEHLYDIPRHELAEVYATAQLVAIAIRATYACDGTSTRQHNERGGGQDVWHFHVHVFPRYAGDDLYARDAETRWASADDRARYAERLRMALASLPPPRASDSTRAGPKGARLRHE